MKKGEKKTDIRISIKYNKKILWIAALFIILLIVLIYFIVKNNNDKDEGFEIKECQTEKDCAPSSCCHAESCVPLNKKPDCEGIFCSMICSGPLDCGAGHCGCVNDKCKIIND